MTTGSSMRRAGPIHTILSPRQHGGCKDDHLQKTSAWRHPLHAVSCEQLISFAALAHPGILIAQPCWAVPQSPGPGLGVLQPALPPSAATADALPGLVETTATADPKNTDNATKHDDAMRWIISISLSINTISRLISSTNPISNRLS